MESLVYIFITVVTLGMLLPWLARIYSSWRAMKGDEKFSDAEARRRFVWPFRIVGWVLIIIAFALFFFLMRDAQ